MPKCSVSSCDLQFRAAISSYHRGQGAVIKFFHCCNSGGWGDPKNAVTYLSVMIFSAPGLVFLGFQGPPKNSRPKFTPKLVGIPLQFHFRTQNLFTPIFCLWERSRSRSFFQPQPPSLLILLSEPGSERKVLTKET